MKAKKFIAVICMILAMFMLSSCSRADLIRTVDSLLTPPLYYSEYEGLVTAFNNSVGENVILCNPANGDNLSAITVSDIDGDKSEEAIIFYRYATDSLNVRFSVFDSDNGEWKKAGDYIGFGDEVYSLELLDMDNNDSSEIIILWGFSGTSVTNVITVYKISQSGRLSQIVMDSCEFSRVADMDDDGKNEILYISSSNNGRVTVKKAHLLRLVDGNLTEVSCIPVDSNVISYVSFKECKYEGSPLKIYLDAAKSNSSMITELLYWDKDRQTLVDPFYDEETSTSNRTLRYEQITCADINGDGHPEVPVQYVPDNEDISGLHITSWVSFESEYPVTVAKTFVNVADGYLVDFSKLNVTPVVSMQKSGRITDYVVYDESVGSDNILLTVSTIPAEDYSEGGDYGVYILKNNDVAVCAITSDYGEIHGITESSLRDIITKLPS